MPRPAAAALHAPVGLCVLFTFSVKVGAERRCLRLCLATMRGPLQRAYEDFERTRSML